MEAIPCQKPASNPRLHEDTCHSPTHVHLRTEVLVLWISGLPAFPPRTQNPKVIEQAALSGKFNSSARQPQYHLASVPFMQIPLVCPSRREIDVGCLAIAPRCFPPVTRFPQCLVACTARHGSAFSSSAAMLSTPTAFVIKKEARVCSTMDIASVGALCPANCVDPANFPGAQLLPILCSAICVLIFSCCIPT